MSSENGDEISTSISTSSVNHDRLVLMLDTALAYVFMVMFWRSHLTCFRLIMLMLVLMR